MSERQRCEKKQPLPRPSVTCDTAFKRWPPCLVALLSVPFERTSHNKDRDNSDRPHTGRSALLLQPDLRPHTGCPGRFGRTAHLQPMREPLTSGVPEHVQHIRDPVRLLDESWHPRQLRTAVPHHCKNENNSVLNQGKAYRVGQGRVAPGQAVQY